MTGRFAAFLKLTAMTEQAGLRTVPIPIDSQELFASERGRSILAAGKTTLFLKELGHQEAQQREALDDALIRACQGADLVVSGVLTAVRAASINVGAPAVPAAPRAARGRGPWRLSSRPGLTRASRRCSSASAACPCSTRRPRSG